MYKRNEAVSLSALSMFTFTALCLLSTFITANSQMPANKDKQRLNSTLVETKKDLDDQQTTQQKPGAPLKGVDVKLGKNPGGQVVSRITDQKGNFDFGILPKGSYYLTILLPEETKNAAGTPVAVKENGLSNSSIKTCLITINNGMGKPINRGWDFEKKKAFDPAAQSTGKTKYNVKTNVSSRTDAGEKTIYEEKIILESDGSHPVNGAVVKSKSNISNN